jgi:hypothetical protein
MAKAKKNDMLASDFNMETLNTAKLMQHVLATIKVHGNIAIFGRRGTGKTEISKQAIKKENLIEVYMNLSVLERVDMGGYPNVMSASRNSDYVDFLLPAMYEKMMYTKAEEEALLHLKEVEETLLADSKYKKNITSQKAYIEAKEKYDSVKQPNVVALLDEVDKADPSLWAPMLEFTQFHSMNGRSLPKLQAVIMTGNLISEGGLRPSLPLLDRAEKYLVEADAKMWLNWAGDNGNIHPAVTAFIADHPSELFGASDPEGRYADPSPRGWTRLSDLVYRGEKFNWSSDIINTKACGCVGKSAGIKYQSYYDHYQKLLPVIEKVFKGESIKKEYVPMEPSQKMVAVMIICNRFAALLDEAKEKGEKKPECIAHVGKFFNGYGSKDMVDPEMFLMGMRSQVQITRLMEHSLDEHPNWSELIKNLNKRAKIEVDLSTSI